MLGPEEIAMKIITSIHILVTCQSQPVSSGFSGIVLLLTVSRKQLLNAQRQHSGLRACTLGRKTGMCFFLSALTSVSQLSNQLSNVEYVVIWAENGFQTLKKFMNIYN